MGPVSSAHLSPGPAKVPGAYGLRIAGAPAGPGQLVEVPFDWPQITLAVEPAQCGASDSDYLDAREARLRLSAGGIVQLERPTGHTTFRVTDPPPPAALIHPLLASVGAVWAWWHGRDAFHAGAFVAAGGVWALLGDKGAGKSSLLAALHLAGLPIVCDDVLVLDGPTAFAGPRSIDLRADTARRLRLGTSLGVIGDRERWRVSLDPVAPSLPFQGWIRLRWEEGVALRPVRGAERLTELMRHRALNVPAPSPKMLLGLAELPVFELARPRDWGSTDEVLKRLLEAVTV